MTKIYYFSGSGNSLKVAKDIASGIEEAELVPIAKVALEKQEADLYNLDAACSSIGIVFPVYAWGLPRLVLRFAERLKTDKYVFAVTTYGGSTGFTLRQLEKVLQRNSTRLNAAFDIQMPDCYIPMFDAHPDAEQQRMFKEEAIKVEEIVRAVKRKETVPTAIKRTITNYVLSGIVYKSAIRYFPLSSKSFWVKESCNSCGICKRVCPVQNVQLKAEKPHWGRNCEACMACLQWCPVRAIEYGKKSRKRKRYHHPGVEVKEMLLNE